MSGLAQGSIGAIMVALSVWAYFRNRFAKARVWAVFIGILLFGFTGPVLHWIARALAFVAGLLGLASGKWLGISAATLTAIIVILMFAELLHGVHPKGSAKKSTYWIAAALAIMAVAGATPFAAVNGLPGDVQHGISQTQG
jgi:hypothetical protein